MGSWEVSIQGEEFLDKLSGQRLLKKDAAYWSQQITEIHNYSFIIIISMRVKACKEQRHP